MREKRPAPEIAQSAPLVQLPGVTAGAEPTIVVNKVSKWFGDIVAVSDVTFGVTRGVTALLGPNGAGKSTLLKMMSGLVNASSGKITIDGRAPRGNRETYRRFGLVHESEHVYPFLTGREFVRMNAIMQKLRDVDGATEQAISLVEMAPAAERKIGGYSKGMRQRIKVAAALVHQPDVILMDEPLNGMDPAQRAHMISLIRELGNTKTVLVSSHVLAEVERFADNILVIVNGKLAAAGDYRAIREKIDDRDHSVRIRADFPRSLAVALIGHPSTRSVRVDGDARIVVETNDVRGFYRALPQQAKRANVRLFEVTAADESLQSVFAYLVER
jgi:ABC-2 type transport system ATP-binding protein